MKSVEVLFNLTHLYIFSEFNLDDKSKNFIVNAKNEYSDWCNSLSIDYILYEQLTKEACKKLKVSPDCIMQLGFQVKVIFHLKSN